MTALDSLRSAPRAGYARREPSLAAPRLDPLSSAPAGQWWEPYFQYFGAVGDPEVFDSRRRARILVIACHGAAILAVSSGALRLALSKSLPVSYWLSLGITIVAMLSGPLVLRQTRSVRMAAVLPIAATASTLPLMAIGAGGLDAPVLGVLPTVPLVAAFFIGGRGAKLLAATLMIELGALAEASIRDHLTNVANRRYFAQRLEEELAVMRRHGATFSVLILDVDHFKHVNDLRGHAAGDAVLVDVASLLSSNLRTEDLVARYGGEEFVVLLRNTPLDGARVAAERLRRAVENHAFYHAGGSFTVTVSIGCASADGVRSAEELLQVADRRLYDAKKSGRNCVVSTDPVAAA